ncbi:MAG: serine/threonine-protein kinase [Myxococcales bacterium]
MPQTESHDTLATGTLLGRYEIRRLLGRGGMGCVYEAVHRDLKKRVAIKTLLPALAANSEARMRFMREGESASRIHHPHVVDVTDVGAEGKVIYLVMEYLQGEDLSTLIARQGALSPGQTVDIMLPVAAAISTAHEMGVIHRDLKPENIFLATSTVGGEFHPKVLDFGISKVTSDNATMVLTGTGAIIGSTFYLPPEQLQRARSADAQSDQYAIGTIIYECVTGERAFEGENLYAVLKHIAEGRYVPPRIRQPNLPLALEGLIVRALSLDPAGRFGSVKELGAALLAFANPHARAVWTTFFQGALVGHVQRPGKISGAGGTMIMPTGEVDGARMAVTQPPSSGRERTPSPSASTLGHANGEAMNVTGPVVDLRRRSRVPLVLAIGAMAIAGVVMAVMRLSNGGTNSRSPAGAITSRNGRTAPPDRSTFRVEIETDPRSATIELDGRVVGIGFVNERLQTDGQEHVIVTRAPGYQDMTVRFTDDPPPHLLTLDRPPVTRPQPAPPPVASHPTRDGASQVERRRSDRKTAATRATRTRAREGTSPPRTPGSNPNGAPIID